jgi:ubinuclein
MLQNVQRYLVRICHIFPFKRAKRHKKHKVAAFQPTDFVNKSRTSETYDYASAYRDKGPSTQLDFQQEKTYSGENQDLANKIYHKEKHGTSDFSGITLPGTSCPTQAMVRFLSCFPY